MHRDNASNAFAAGLIARAEELAPVLDARAGEANAIGRIPADTLADLQAAGFFKVLQPKRYGGYELDPQTFFDIQMALARGCMSTAWVYGVVGVHNWQLALFDGARLGGEFARLRPPSPGTLIGGRMSVTSNGHELSRRRRNHRTGNDVRLHRLQSCGEALHPVRREWCEPPRRRNPGRQAMTNSMGPD